jgi:hypothetical protein
MQNIGRQNVASAQWFPKIRKMNSERRPSKPPRTWRTTPIRALPSFTTVRWFIWIQIVLGWLFTTLFLAAVSGIVQHE